MIIDNNAAATSSSRNIFITRCDDKFAAVASTSPAATVAVASTSPAVTVAAAVPADASAQFAFFQ